MTPSPEIQSQILAFIAFSIPLILAIWKIFSLFQGVEDKLNDQIRDVDRKLQKLAHLAQLRQAQMDSLNDKLVLSVNGTKELVEHVRTRTKAEHDRLDERICQIERFLTKTTPFQPRE